jgi:redox-sensing transcriptional repressor
LSDSIIKPRRRVAKATLRRMPYYLDYILQRQSGGDDSVSATNIASALHLNDVQVRKDLAMISKNGGRPKTGYEIRALAEDITEYMGYNHTHLAALVGIGNLGRTLLSYEGFSRYGLSICCAFDANPSMVGDKVGGLTVCSMDQLPAIFRVKKPEIGIIAVPAAAAQPVCDTLLTHGVKAIWNFSPIMLQVPSSVPVQNENMALSISVLSQHLASAGNPDPQ